MVLAQGQKTQTIDDYRQRYGAAGVTSIIAASAAELRAWQEQGGELSQVQQEILDFANQALTQQEELQNLNDQAQALKSSAPEQSSELERGQQEADGKAQSLNDINQRRTELAAGLSRMGVPPETDPAVIDQAQTNHATVELTPIDVTSTSRSNKDTPAPAMPLDSVAPIPEDRPDDRPQQEPPELTLERTKTPDQQLLQDARSLVAAAEEAGLTETEGGVTRLRGRKYTVTQMGSTTIIEGQDQGKLLADDDDILKADGFSEADYETFGKLGQMSAEELKQEAQASEADTPKQGPKPEYQLQATRKPNLQL